VIVALADNCPLLGSVNTAYLNAFLTTVLQGRNCLATPPPERLFQLVDGSIEKIYGDILRQSYKRIVNTSYQRWVSHDECGDCDADAVSVFYAMATTVIVENVSSDGAWLALIAGQLRPRLKRELSGQSPFVILQQGGGIGELPKMVERIASMYGKKRPKGAPLKVVVIADGDSAAPGEESPAARQVVEAAKANAADVHILAKRSIENYVPDRALLGYADARGIRQTAQLIVGLTSIERDHYPMKRGLEERDLQPQGIFHSSLDLGVGMGDFVVDLIRNFGHMVDSGGLKVRDGKGELEELLDIIEGNV
jgi:hypothetical protein